MNIETWTVHIPYMKSNETMWLNGEKFMNNIGHEKFNNIHKFLSLNNS